MNEATLNEKFTRWYFDTVYNPCYDFTTARFGRYRQLQERCLAKLSFSTPGRTGNVLCVGAGTGNEITRILRLDPDAEITAIDYSTRALEKARQKAEAAGKDIKALPMDARQLEFPQGTFERVLCIHVMDFLSDSEAATAEIVRVVKKGGEFVITFPSDNEGPGLGKAFFEDSVSEDKARGRNLTVAYLRATGKLLMGFVYLPLYMRKGKKVYSRPQLEARFKKFGSAIQFDMEEEAVYRDFIVHGTKVKQEDEHGHDQTGR